MATNTPSKRNAILIADSLTLSGDITAPSYNNSNWDTAYNWGNHADANYLTSYTETDTLDSVTDRGATTTNALTVGSLTTGTGGNVTAYGNITATYGFVFLC